MWDFIKGMLKSRKFWGAVLAFAAFVGTKLGLQFDPEEALAAASPFLTYILGVAWEDGKAKGAGTLPPATK